MATKKNLTRTSKTDWKRVDALKDQDIDRSDVPELDAAFFKSATLWPGNKKQITLRLDPDLLGFFRRKGPRYQTMINSVLRRYMESEQRA